MGYSFQLPVGLTPAEMFDALPKSAKSFLQRGFQTLAQLYPKHAQAFSQIVLNGVNSSQIPDAKNLVTTFAIKESEAKTLSGVLSFLALVISRPGEEEPISELVSGLLSAELIDKSAEDAVRGLLRDLEGQWPRITAKIRRAAIARRLLPSLDELHLTVDIRPDFQDDKITEVVPVVLVHLDTDAAHEEIWLQMSKEQVQQAILDFQKILKQVEAVEAWAGGLQR